MHNSAIYSIVCKMATCFTVSTLLGRKEITMYDSESSFWHFLKCIDPDSIPGFRQPRSPAKSQYCTFQHIIWFV